MKTRVRFTGVLFAICALLAGALPGHAAVLVGTQGSSFLSLTELGTFRTFQPLADLQVIGTGDVPIIGFGVYGAAEATGKVRWVFFENDSLLWQSGSIDVAPGSAKWYDVNYSTTLVSGNTYTMGIVANDMFAWGQNTEFDEGYGAIAKNGLQIETGSAIAQFDIAQGNDFTGEPFLLRGFNLQGYQTQTSLRVFDGAAEVPPIPEPAEWSMLLAGLMVIAFVANRRRRLAI